MRNIKETLLHRFVTRSDEEAFSEIVRQHAGMVYGACLRILQDEDKAADAAQETFFQLLRNAEQIRGSVSGWLHRAATSRSIDRIRRDSVRRRHETQYSQERPCPVRRWEEISPCIDEEMDQLDEQTRQILMRHYFEGQTTRVIGKEIGISQSTVSRRIEAGLDLLRMRLSKRGLIVAAAALGGLLGQNAAQAAPVAVMTELSKMALVAGTGTMVASGAGAASVSAGQAAAAGGILAGVKAKVITAAAVVVIGTGSVVTYNHYANSPERRETITVEASADQPSGKADPSQASRTARPGSNITYIEASSEAAPAAAPDTADQDDFDEWFESIFAEELPTDGPARSAGGGAAMGGGYGGFGGGMMGGMAGTPPETDTPEEEIQEGAVRRVRARAAPPPEDSEEAEDKEQ